MSKRLLITLFCMMTPVLPGCNIEQIIPPSTDTDTVSVPDTTVQIYGVAITTSSIVSQYGVCTPQTVQVTAVVYSNRPVSMAWSSSNPAVATVDAAGVVTFRGLGTATITVTVVGKATWTASVSVTLTPCPAVDTTTTGSKVTGMSITPATVTMKMCVGLPAPTQQLTAKVEPATVDQSVTWSMNSAVASVNSTGLVTAKSLGQTMATARSVADTTVARNATIIVNDEGCGVAPADSTIQIVPDTITVGAGQTVTPTVVCRINGTITSACQPWFRSTSEEVAVVGPSSGIVTAIKPGTTRIIAQWSMLKQFPADTSVVIVPSG